MGRNGRKGGLMVDLRAIWVRFGCHFGQVLGSKLNIFRIEFSSSCRCPFCPFWDRFEVNSDVKLMRKCTNM